MECKEILPHIFHLNFDTRKELASTFLRFQEHFESPSFRGKIFSLDDFKYWYVKNSPKGKETGEFTYYSDWSGFNIPSEILIPFQDGLFNPLSDQEKSFLDLFEDKERPFYIIGTFQGEKTTLKHEIAHALFYTNKEYRDEVLNVLHDIPDEFKQVFSKALEESGGYHYSVILDEMHAYMINGLEKLKKKGLNTFPFLRFQKRLQEIFNKYNTIDFN